MQNQQASLVQLTHTHTHNLYTTVGLGPQYVAGAMGIVGIMSTVSVAKEISMFLVKIVFLISKILTT